MRPRSRGTIVLFTCLCAAAGAAQAGALVHDWSRRFGDIANPQVGLASAADVDGNAIITGYFQGTVNFGGSDLVSAGSDDIFVAKFDAAGNHLWSQRFGDASGQIGSAVTTDASGNVVVVGQFAGTVNFGGGNLTTGAASDIFVVKFDPAGVHQWSKRFGDLSGQSATCVDVDAGGNVVVGGSFEGTVNFGGINLTSAGSTDVFVVKFDAVGIHLWSQRAGDGSSQTATSLAVDAGGNTVITGHFQGTVNFGGGNLASAASEDIFVAKFDAAGVHQWSRAFGDANAQYGIGATTDANGNVVVTGGFFGTVDFGGSNLTCLGSSADVYLVKFDPAGNHLWSQRFGDATEQFGSGVATDTDGNVILGGTMEGVVDFGGTALASAGQHDVFMAVFTPDGVHQWSQRFGDTENQTHLVPATHGSDVLITGLYYGSIDFGGQRLDSAGGTDIFLARLRGLPVASTITSILDIGNDQGRKVKIRFLRSGLDDGTSPTPVVRYEAFRRDDSAPGVAGGNDPWGPEKYAARLDGWTQVGTVSAYAEETYGIDVPTIADSTVAAGPYDSVFFIRAATSTPTVFYDSLPDSGFSLDNLAPGVPANLAYGAGTLNWVESSAADFDYFTVYGSNASSFASATAIDYTVATALDVSASPYAFYFVTATDFSGNEGKAAAVAGMPSGLDATPRTYVLSISSYPNPFNPSTTVRYTVPSRGRTVVSVYDLRGAHVSTLVDEIKDAGAHTQSWDGTDDLGKVVSSGVYFARVTHPHGTRGYKLVLVK